MGWDDMGTREYPCACGKGTYSEFVEMDDWNRIRTSRTIHCPECAKKEKEFRVKLNEDRERLEKISPGLRNYFEENYMELWLSYFNFAKTKKDVWTLAKEIGVEHSSLSTFYQHTKGKSMSEYIKKLVNYKVVNHKENMLIIIGVLGIEDKDFKSKLEKAIELGESVYKRSIALNQW